MLGEDRWAVAGRIGVVVLAVVLPLSTLTTFGFYPGGYYAGQIPRWEVVTAWLLAAAFVPLHLVHVRHGLRGEVPPHGRETFAAMLAVMAAGEVVIGHVWTFMFASLVASALLVFRPPWSIAWALGVTAACYPLGTDVFGEGGWYVTVLVANRSASLFSLVWLVAGVRRLALAREALAERAMARERARVDTELVSSLHHQLTRMEGAARRAAASTTDGDAVSAREALAQVTGDSRTALATARSVVSDLRHSSHQDLRAAARLLAASGAPQGRP